MIRVEEVLRSVEAVLPTVPERVTRARQPARHEQRVVRHATQGQVHAHRRKLPHLRGEVCVAGTDLRGQGAVLRWHAFDRIDDAGVHERQGIVRGDGYRCAREPGLVERAVQEDTCVVSRERPAGAVRPVHAGGETDDDDARRCGAEGRHRTRPVVRVRSARPGPKAHESRAAPAVRIVDRSRPGPKRCGASLSRAQSWHACRRGGSDCARQSASRAREPARD